FLFTVTSSEIQITSVNLNLVSRSHFSLLGTASGNSTDKKKGATKSRSDII
ncbi:MAG: hypothetical protein ACI8ZM_005739, partial [Crocinitomix sp.]